MPGATTPVEAVPDTSRSRRPRLLPALLPVSVVLVSGLAWVGLRTGGIPGGDDRVAARLSATTGDWVLALGLLVTVAVTVVLVVRRRRSASLARCEQQARAQVGTQAARERQLLLGRLDHELKNPLTAMRVALANVAAEETPAPQKLRGLRSIEEQVLRLSRLTADLRKIAEIETGPLTRRPVDLTALLEEAVEVVGEQPRAEGRRISLDVPRAPWPLPRVPGDGDLLALALVNLVDNAVKYTPEGGRVEVRGRETGDGVLVEVADTGQGIPAEDLPHIWDELFRSPSARTVAGSGLGLPLVRAVVERHGGTVSAQSREGEGTVVRLVLPVQERGSSTTDPDGSPVTP